MATFLLDVINPTADQGLSGWTVTGDILIGDNTSTPNAPVGEFYWYCQTTSASMSQVVNLPTEFINVINEGRGRIGTQFFYGNNSTPRGSGYRVTVTALSSGNDNLGLVYDSGTLVGPDEDVWYYVNTLNAPIVINSAARKVRIDVVFGDGVNPSNGIFDNILVFITDGLPTNVRLNGVETNISLGISSNLALTAVETFYAYGEGGRMYEEGLRLSGLEANVAFGTPGVLHWHAAEVFYGYGEGGRIYEVGLRVNGVEAHVAFGTPGILHLLGAESHYAMGKASDLKCSSYEVHICSSVRQKYTPIVAIMNDIPDVNYIKTNRFGICYEQPVRG